MKRDGRMFQKLLTDGIYGISIECNGPCGQKMLFSMNGYANLL